MMDIQGQLSYAIWLTLPADVRHKLVILFDIPRSGRTVGEYRATGAVVTSDGYTAPDLQTISLSKMRGLLDSDSENFYKLFEETVSNIDALLGGTFERTGVTLLQPATAPEERVVFDAAKTQAGGIKPAFCDQCTSRGGRHKIGCPKR